MGVSVRFIFMGFFRKISDKLTIVNTRMEHADGVSLTVRAAFNVVHDEDCDDCIGASALRKQLERFPEGQFVALYEDEDAVRVVGTAHTMITIEPPHPGTWEGTIGDISIPNHNPQGEWLYGVEMAVRPDYQGYGVGTALYQARFDLVRRLNLRGWYAGGMLMGYPRYRDTLSPLEYGEKVISGELQDPTVSMQMKRGFVPLQVIEDYMEETQAGNAAILILWSNPDYKEQS
jgi:GNAT superfamily N-acetyltransferase